ncbi:MAG: Kelch repeat-containing protein [Gemmatimonadota bacterium]
MRSRFVLALAACAGGLGCAAAPTAELDAWSEAPALPAPLTNNAVAAWSTGRGAAVFSFLGLDTTKRWDGIVSAAWRWEIGDSAWTAAAAVPGPGRIAATAQAVGGRIYLFGGYTVVEDGSEASLPNVDIYDPLRDEWSEGAPIPVPVDDAVSGVWRDSLIYLVSGWHDRDNVADVQIYDPAADAWSKGTPIPGPPVFGHAGSLAGDDFIYLGGARTVRGATPRFRIEGSAWRGTIDPEHPTRIRWTRLPDPPGPPLYRAAAGTDGRRVIFAGGTDNPYNYDGLGYDGVESRPRSEVFAFDTEAGAWRELPPLPVASMDHRGIAVAGGRLFVVGGMEAGRKVTARVARAALDRLLAGAAAARESPTSGGDEVP